MKEQRPPSRRNPTRKSIARQVRSQRPQVVSELLTLREAAHRWPELYPERIYAWVREGRLHPVKPAGRILYPEWELHELVAELRERSMKAYGPREVA